MGEPLLCPRCKVNTLKWDNESLIKDEKEEIDLLEEGILYCPSSECNGKWVGMKAYIIECNPESAKIFYPNTSTSNIDIILNMLFQTRDKFSKEAINENIKTIQYPKDNISDFALATGKSIAYSKAKKAIELIITYINKMEK